MTRTTSQTLLYYALWLLVSLASGAGAYATGGLLSRVLFVVAVVAAALPLAGWATRALSTQRPSLALTGLAAAAAWLLAGQSVFAYASLATALTLQLVLDVITSRARATLDAHATFAPPLVRVLRAHREKLIAYAKVHRGDRITIKRGERIPVDGRLISKVAHITPAFGKGTLKVTEGEQLTSGDTTHDEAIIEAELVGTETTQYVLADTVSRLVRSLNQPTSARVLAWTQVLWIVAALLWQTIAAPSTAVLQGGLLIWAGTWWLGQSLMMLLVVRKIGVALASGLVIKTLTFAQRATHITTLVLNKTGTLTTGTPDLVQVQASAGLDDADVIRLAAALEQRGDHPIGVTLRRTASELKLKLPHVVNLQTIQGRGMQGEVEGELFGLGSHELVSEFTQTLDPALAQAARAREEQGATIVFLVSSKRVLGMLALMDTPRPSAAPLVAQLQRRGLTVEVVSGDAAPAVTAVANAAGIAADHTYSDMLPKAKVEHVRQKESHTTAVVAHPLTDSQLLAASTLGIGFGGYGPVLASPATHVLVRAPQLTLVDTLFGLAHMLRIISRGAPLIASVTALVLGALVILTL